MPRTGRVEGASAGGKVARDLHKGNMRQPHDLPGILAMVKHQAEEDDVDLVHLGADKKGRLGDLVKVVVSM